MSACAGHTNAGATLAHRAKAHPDQDTALAELEDCLADDVDLEVELERKELIELLDRALALLPPETRIILIKCYVEESPVAEVAAQLGINAMAAAMRLQRTKLALRRVLTRDLSQELVAYGIHTSGTDQWEETRLWCPCCGKNRLLGHFIPNNGGLLLHCPACKVGTEGNIVDNHRAELFGYAKTYKPAFSRLLTWGETYYSPIFSPAQCLAYTVVAQQGWGAILRWMHHHGYRPGMVIGQASITNVHVVTPRTGPRSFFSPCPCRRAGASCKSIPECGSFLPMK
jgi:hypothetical protein